jgi:hypothetical protein
VASTRSAALAGLNPRRVDAREVTQRLKQLQALGDAGSAVQKIAAGDPELQHQASDAIAFAQSGRAAISILGNSLDVARTLLGAPINGRGAPSVALDGVTVYLSLDKAGICRGVYIVGDPAAGRLIKSVAWPVARLISQAVGHPVVVPVPANGQSSSRWYTGGTLVVVRWLNGAAVELRIGDATP